MTEFDHWIERWRQGMTGWHRDEVNPRLLQHGADCLPAEPCSVFVPLCGASLDMLWLRDHGYHVIGNDISELAAGRFFSDAGIPTELAGQDRFLLYSGGGIRFWVGDYFSLRAEQLGDVGMVYDRAALIAMPRDRRPDYAHHLIGLAGAAPILLVTLEYDQPAMQGPPYSVSEDEVRALFGGDYAVELLVREDVLAQEPRFRERGLHRLHECVYRLTGRQAAN